MDCLGQGPIPNDRCVEGGNQFGVEQMNKQRWIVLAGDDQVRLHVSRVKHLAIQPLDKWTTASVPPYSFSKHAGYDGAL